MVTQVLRSQTSIFICRVIDCPAFDIQSTATVCQFNGVCSRIECTVCSDMRIHHERQREVFISELISPRQVETGSFVLLEHFILVIQYSIAILVYIFEVTRLISIFGRFFFFSKLPYAITFVIPDLVGVMTDKPLVFVVVSFLLTNHITVFILDVFHISVKMFDLTTVERESNARIPVKVLSAHHITIQRQFETTVCQSTQVCLYIREPGDIRQRTFNQQVVRFRHIGFHRTSQSVVEQRKVQTNIIRTGTLPFQSRVTHVVYIDL